MIGAEQFRARFPVLDTCVYLASCSLPARSIDLDDAMAEMLAAMSAQGAAWHEFEDQVTIVRERFAALIGARPDQIALLPNASIGAYQVASTIDWTRRARVVTTLAEFPSVAQVWLAQQPHGAETIYVDEPSLEHYAGAIDERTALVSVPHTTYRDSARLPVAEIAAVAHEAGARVFVDAYQASGVDPIDVDALGCDYLVTGASKYLLGMPGLAFLYARAAPAGDLAPQLTGWFGRVNPFAFDPRGLDFPDAARRFETGTPPVPSVYATKAGLGLLARVDLHEVRRHVGGLVAEAVHLLTERNETVRTPVDPAQRGAHVALRDPDPVALADYLAKQRIFVSPRGDVCRFAFHYYNTVDDVKAVCAAINNYRGA